MWSLRVLYVLLFIAVFANFLANDKPLYAVVAGETQFPVFRDLGMSLGVVEKDGNFLRTQWKSLDYASVIYPPIPYSSTGIDFKNARYKSPFDEQNVPSFRFRHHLGTDRLGRDVTAGMIYGTRTALLVGILAMSVAGFIGIFFGVLSGWYGDDRFKTTRARVLMNILAILPAWFYAFSVRSFAIAETENPLWEIGLSLLILIAVFALFNLLARTLEKINVFKKSVTVPVDLLVMRFIEVMNSIPALLLLLAATAVLTKQSIITTMLIIGLIAWTSIARFTRAELLRIRNLEYIESARALGLSDLKIIWRHALPNALTPILITLAFGIAGAVLLESTLSFLGLGAGADEMTWGQILKNARDYFSAWWLAVFPGTAIFITVTAFNLIGEGLTDALEGRE